MIRERLYFEDAIYRFESLVVYRNLQNDPILKGITEISSLLARDKENNKLMSIYYDWLSVLVKKAEEKGFCGNIFRKYVIDLYLSDDNIFSLACERKQVSKSLNIYQLVQKDVEILQFYMDFDVANICENVGYGENVMNYKPIKQQEQPIIEQIESLTKATEIIEQLVWVYENVGVSPFANIKAANLVNRDGQCSFVAVPNFPTVIYSDLICYKSYEEVLMDNTTAFLASKESDNILIAGSFGTGKTSLVNATINNYSDKGLKMVVVKSEQISCLPEIVASLSKRGKKFIIFIENINVTKNDENYETIKLLLNENSTKSRSNVKFYITANLLRANEISDLFGVKIEIDNLTNEQYQEIVAGIAKKEKLNIADSFLREQALSWKTTSGKFSGATARHFINDVIAEMKKV